MNNKKTYKRIAITLTILSFLIVYLANTVLGYLFQKNTFSYQFLVFVYIIFTAVFLIPTLYCVEILSKKANMRRTCIIIKVVRMFYTIVLIAFVVAHLIWGSKTVEIFA